MGLFYLFLYLPLSVLLIYSFNIEGFPSPWKEFTFKWYHELFNNSFVWTAFGNSLIVASFATLICLALGLFLIFYAHQGGKMGSILTFFYGNLVIPETVLAVSLLGFFTLFSIPLGLMTLIFAHSVMGLGIGVPILYASFLELDPKLNEASYVLGASPLQTFFRVTLPLMLPSIITTALLIFIISFDDFALSYFCAGSTAQTLSLYILSMLRSGISPIVNSLSAILLLLSSILVFTFFSLKSRKRIL
jgi:spermidine/putrescine transport system permease protein